MVCNNIYEFKLRENIKSHSVSLNIYNYSFIDQDYVYNTRGEGGWERKTEIMREREIEKDMEREKERENERKKERVREKGKESEKKEIGRERER